MRVRVHVRVRCKPSSRIFYLSRTSNRTTIRRTGICTTAAGVELNPYGTVPLQLTTTRSVDDIVG